MGEVLTNDDIDAVFLAAAKEWAVSSTSELVDFQRAAGRGLEARVIAALAERAGEMPSGRYGEMSGPPPYFTESQVRTHAAAAYAAGLRAQAGKPVRWYWPEGDTLPRMQAVSQRRSPRHRVPLYALPQPKEAKDE